MSVIWSVQVKLGSKVDAIISQILWGQPRFKMLLKMDFATAFVDTEGTGAASTHLVYSLTSTNENLHFESLLEIA